VTGAEFRGVDIDLLADYIGGVLVGTPDESVVATLIADDLAWRSAYESLGGGMATVGAELGRFAAEPMPDDVAARLEAAFATAPSPLSLVRDPEPDGDGAPDVPLEDAPKRERGAGARPKRSLRWVTPIAIAAGMVAFVGFGLDYLAGREGSRSDDTLSSTAAGGYAESQSRSDSGSAALSGPQADTESVTPKLEAPPSPQIIASGTDYTKATLADAVVKPMAQSGAPDRPTAAASGPLHRLSTAAGLQDCLDMIAAANGGGHLEAQSVDFARYEGEPAIVVRFTATDGKTWAMASGPSCGTPSGGADTLAKVPVR
jgi:hypothetical protein